MIVLARKVKTENSSEPNERALAGNKKGKSEKSVTKRRRRRRYHL